MKRAAFLLLGICFFCGPPRPPEPVQPEEIIPSSQEVARGLKSDQWSERSQAVLMAGRGRYAALVPDLLEMLSRDPHPAVRQTAALVLADFGEQRAADPIARMLSAGDMSGADMLIDALARLKNPAAAYAVVPYLDADMDQIRLGAVNALGEMKALEQGARVLAMAQKNQSRDKARTYCMALGRLRYTPADAYLLGVMRAGPQDPAMAAAILALGNTKSVSAIGDLVRVIGSSYAKGRENAVPALIEIGHSSAAQQSFVHLEHDSAEVRYAAVEVIASIPWPGSAPQAMQLLDKKSQRGTGPASMILGRLKHKPAREKIEAALGDRGMADRENIARSLGWLGEKSSAVVLVRVLQEDDGEGRYGAAWSLGVLKAPEGFEPLKKAVRSSDRKLQQISIEALGSYASLDSLSTLGELLEDPVLSIYAVDSISNVPGADARKLLMKHVAKQKGGARKAGIAALGRRKEPESVGFLVDQLREEPSGDVQESLMNALREITGERFIGRAGWVDWYERTH